MVGSSTGCIGIITPQCRRSEGSPDNDIDNCALPFAAIMLLFIVSLMKALTIDRNYYE